MQIVCFNKEQRRFHLRKKDVCTRENMQQDTKTACSKSRKLKYQLTCRECEALVQQAK